jgi:hypothetical protein
MNSCYQNVVKSEQLLCVEKNVQQVFKGEHAQRSSGKTPGDKSRLDQLEEERDQVRGLEQPSKDKYDLDLVITNLTLICTFFTHPLWIRM